MCSSDKQHAKCSGSLTKDNYMYLQAFACGVALLGSCMLKKYRIYRNFHQEKNFAISPPILIGKKFITLIFVLC